MALAPAKSELRAILDHAPWKPDKYEPEDAAAIQALASGRASAAPQRRALKWIIEDASSTYDMSYRPGGPEGDRDTVLAEGRRMVGNQIVKLLKVKIGQLRRAP